VALAKETSKCLEDTSLLKNQMMESDIGRTLLDKFHGDIDKITQLASLIKSIKVLAWKR